MNFTFDLIEIFSLEFMQNALIGAFLISILCGIVSTIIVSNNMGFITASIAHGSYGGIGMAIFLGISPLLGASIFSVFLAILIAFLSLKDTKNFDTIVGAIWAFGMSLGVIFSDLKQGSGVDLANYLFGSILTIEKNNLIFTAIFDAILIMLLIAFYHQIVLATFDKEFAKTKKIKTDLIYYLTIILISISSILTIQMVGLILVMALFSIPTYIANKFAKNIPSLMIFSSLISFIFCFLGIILSYNFNLTCGACIIILLSIALFMLIITQKLLNLCKR